MDNSAQKGSHSGLSPIVYAELLQNPIYMELDRPVAVELYPVSKDALTGPAFVGRLAIIYVMVGEYEAALDQIEYLLSIPTFGFNVPSVPMLRLDPHFDSLRNHPRFQKLLQKYS